MRLSRLAIIGIVPGGSTCSLTGVVTNLGKCFSDFYIGAVGCSSTVHEAAPWFESRTGQDANLGNSHSRAGVPWGWFEGPPVAHCSPLKPEIHVVEFWRS
jgi:hypothetical protein